MALENSTLKNKIYEAETSGRLAPEWNSDSAWLRLEAQMEPVKNNKKGFIWYVVAASITIILGIVGVLNFDSKNTEIAPIEIVFTPTVESLTQLQIPDKPIPVKGEIEKKQVVSSINKKVVQNIEIAQQNPAPKKKPVKPLIKIDSSEIKLAKLKAPKKDVLLNKRKPILVSITPSENQKEDSTIQKSEFERIISESENSNLRRKKSKRFSVKFFNQNRNTKQKARNSRPPIATFAGNGR